MEENKEKRTRRTKEQIEADSLLKGNTVSYTPVKRKKEDKKSVKLRDESNFVPGNFNPSYMISETARKDCYVYAVKKVKFDSVLKRQEVGNEFLLTFRVNQVHETAVWDKVNNEMLINTVYRNLVSEYGENVKLVNDPYEYL